MKDLLNSAADFNDALREQLTQWVERVDELETSIGKQSLERDTLRSKIAAAETLLGRAGPAGPYDMSLREHIEALMSDNRSRDAAQIRNGLKALGVAPERVKPTVGSFYTTLKRMVDSGRLKKTGIKYQWNSAFVPKGGGHDTP